MEEGDGPRTVGGGGGGGAPEGAVKKDSPSEINEQLARRKVTFRNKFALGILFRLLRSFFLHNPPPHIPPLCTFLQALFSLRA